MLSVTRCAAGSPHAFEKIDPVRTALVVVDLQNGFMAPDYAAMSTELRESFYRGTFTECLAAGRELSARLDFSKFRRLMDVGGGSGGLSVAMAEAWPHLEITLTDLPTTTAVADRYIDEAGLRSRIRLQPTDIVTGRLVQRTPVLIAYGAI